MSHKLWLELINQSLQKLLVVKSFYRVKLLSWQKVAIAIL